MKREKFESLLDLNDYFRTEKQAISYFIKMRWNGKITCPFKDCPVNEFNVENNKIYILKNNNFKCSCCKKIFSFKTGTIFENSKISMKKWFLASYLQTAHKKGLSSIQLGKYIKVRQATAWFMLQRLRFVQDKNFFNDKFDGTTEMDETYVGGKAENKHMHERIALKGKQDKTCVFGMVNRDTKQVKSMKVESAEYHNLGKKVMENIKMGSNIISDGHSSYITLGKFYKHKSVNHSENEYVRNENESKTAYKVHTNSIEGFWSLVKRTINGTHHWISKKHIDKYLSEMSFRYNTKDFGDAERFNFFLNSTEGRLKYSVLVG